MKRQIQLLAFVASFILAACGGGDGGPTPTPAATATAGVTESSVPAATVIPDPTATPAAHPEGTRTGIPEVDEFLAIHEAGDAAAMADLLLYRDVPCLPPETAEYQVACPDGVEEDTPVSAFILSACHGGWVGEAGRNDLAEELLLREFLVHPVVSVPGHFAIADGDDARDIVLVVVTPDEIHASSFHFAEGGGLVTVAYGCGHSVDDMLSQYGYEDGDVLFAAP